jgi:hypothetical protein
MTQYSHIEEELHIGKNVKKKGVTAEDIDIEMKKKAEVKRKTILWKSMTKVRFIDKDTELYINE